MHQTRNKMHPGLKTLPAECNCINDMPGASNRITGVPARGPALERHASLLLPCLRLPCGQALLYGKAYLSKAARGAQAEETLLLTQELDKPLTLLFDAACFRLPVCTPAEATTEQKVLAVGSSCAPTCGVLYADCNYICNGAG